ncbi:metalloregulator ArsR/SmtB family transcription factor [Aquamicrobium sp. LC103]|uniref:ArsR/SmtB family transcription factor n=1 Tax=Aquamicrobium sp. LC103 TaxID=1120658 RepID=UPI00063E7CB7|nr:metalloregulator ArsR/SmtB family transcription factor [Aquamicrobium sp. LC103]TKT77392.1 winged helix-turn-helix transcriptional regulator [Aquamicrobium sp. LC103]
MISKELVHNADKAAEFLAAIGNGKRFAIMCHLLDGELSVGEIADRVELSQSALSQHLAKLRGLDLVETRRDRQMIYYSCRSSEVRHVMNTLDGIFGAEAPTSEAAE